MTIQTAYTLPDTFTPSESAEGKHTGPIISDLTDTQKDILQNLCAEAGVGFAPEDPLAKIHKQLADSGALIPADLRPAFEPFEVQQGEQNRAPVKP